MFASSNTLLVMMLGKSDALGDLTATNASTVTFAGGGFAVGFAEATGVAKGTTAAPPYTDAKTVGLVDGGDITSSHTGHMSIDFPYGPTPASASASLTFVGTLGVGGVSSASPFDYGH